jgi:sugar lactone lactonase YvrE
MQRDGSDAREFRRSPRGSVDGLAIDAEGGLCVAIGEGGAIARFLPDGQLHELIALPARFVSNLCFGGPLVRDVLITTADSDTLSSAAHYSVPAARFSGLPV